MDYIASLARIETKHGLKSAPTLWIALACHADCFDGQWRAGVEVGVKGKAHPVGWSGHFSCVRLQGRRR